MKAYLPYVPLLLLVLLPARLMHAQWVRTSPLPYPYIQSLAVKDSGLYVGGGYVSVTQDGGATWTTLGDSGLGNHSYGGFLVTDSSIFVGNSWGVSRTTNAGLSWDRKNMGLAYPPPIPQSQTLNVLCFALSGAKLFAGTQAGVFLSTNNGESWAEVNTGLTNADGFNPVHCLLLRGAEMWAGTERGVFWTTNEGANWDSIGNFPGVWALALVVSGDSLFAGGVGGVYVTVRGGNWRLLGPEGMAPSSIQALALAGPVLLAATYNLGVFLSRDLGATWKNVSNGLPQEYYGGTLYNKTLTDLAIVGDNLFGATWGDGVYKISLSAIVSVDDHRSSEIPGEMRLEQNYPNPFNPSTVINYTVGGLGDRGPGASRIRLAVYDVLGREVAVLVDERRTPGSYEVTFDGSGLSSGVYVCRLMAGTCVQSKTMLLIR